MLKTTTHDAVTLLTQALDTLPMEPDPRSDFFIQWRSRTGESIERIFADDPMLLKAFQEIEFSPRRLTRDADKDEQLKLDACLAGCDQARLLLERLITAVNRPPPIVAPVLHVAPVAAAVVLPAVAQATFAQSPFAQPPPVQSTLAQPAAKHSTYATLCLSIAQAVKQSEIDDTGSVLATSAQLLRQLTVGLADPKLRTETEQMLAKIAPGTGAVKKELDWEQADVFVWSILMALGELKRCA